MQNLNGKLATFSSVTNVYYQAGIPLQLVGVIGINVYEWIQSQAIKTPLVFCKWASSTCLVHHISLLNPVWGVWAAVKCPVALLITLAALLHLWPTFIKWATCLLLDVIKVCHWEYIITFSGNVTDILSSSFYFFAVLLFNVIGLIYLPTKGPFCKIRCYEAGIRNKLLSHCYRLRGSWRWRGKLWEN